MVVIENDWLKVAIDEDGAEVRKVEHKKNGMDYMWTGDSTYWGRVSPVLFPIVGRLKGDQYQVDGKTYSMSQHGFLRDTVFQVDEHTTEHASFAVASHGRFKDVYPYEFKAVIAYSLNNDSLQVSWKIINENQEEMYFSIGAHPAFSIPLQDNETLEDYYLNLIPSAAKEVKEYELKEALIHEKGVVDNPSPISLQASLFAKDALVYSNIDQVELISDKSGHGVEIILKDFPFVGIWSKYNEKNNAIAPFVCIEPWHGIADVHNTTGELKEKFGINQLNAGEVFTATYSIKFK